MKFTKLPYLILSSLPVVFSYVNNSTGKIQIPDDVPSDCVTLYKIYEYFKLGRPGYIVGDVMYNCCYYESRRLHSMSTFATTEWECENNTQNKDNYVTSIILSDKNLSGNIPWDLFKNLSQLQILYLNGNELSGDISEITNLNNLSNLQRLNLSNNKLTGILPQKLPPSLSLINVNKNNISGPLPDSWTSKENFSCFVPEGVCRPKSLTNYKSICNTTPNTTPLNECTDEQMLLVKSKSNDENKKLSNGNGSNPEKLRNEKPVEEKIKRSHAVIVTFVIIIAILAIIVSVVACVAKYKNINHEKSMDESLRRHRESLQQQILYEEDTFIKDTAIKSTDENCNFTLSKYSESLYSGNNGSDTSSRYRGAGGSETGSRYRGAGGNEINKNAFEHAILMKNIDGNVDDDDDDDDNQSNSNNNSNSHINGSGNKSKSLNEDHNNGNYLSTSKTIDLDHSPSDPSYSYSSSYSNSFNKYNTTSSYLYDSTYCSTCDHSSASSSSISRISHSNLNGSFESLSYIDYSLDKNNTTSEGYNSHNPILESSRLDNSRTFLNKRSIISNNSNNTLIDQNNNITSTNILNNISINNNSIVSSAGTSTTKYLEEENQNENQKFELEDIKEEKSPSIIKLNHSLDLGEDLEKSITMSFMFKDNFLNESNKDKGLVLNW